MVIKIASVGTVNATSAALRMPLLPEAVSESRREQVLLAGRGAYYLSGQVMQPAVTQTRSFLYVPHHLPMSARRA